MRTQSNLPILAWALGSTWFLACSRATTTSNLEQPDAATSSPRSGVSTDLDVRHAPDPSSTPSTEFQVSTDASSHHSRAPASAPAFDAGASADAASPTNDLSSSSTAWPSAAASTSLADAGGASTPPTNPLDGGVAPLARLVVADPQAYALYVYDIPSLELVGQYDGVHFAEHSGFVPLDDGRVLFADDEALSLNIHDVFGELPGDLTFMAPLVLPPVHLAVDPAHRHAVTTGIGQNGGPDRMTLVDLQTAAVREVDIPTGDPGVLLGGDPLLLYHRNDEPPAFETYAFETLLHGHVELLSSVPLGTGPHGEAIAHAASKLFSATDEGFCVSTASGTELSASRVVPYAANGRSGGRAYYGRLGDSGRFLYSYLRADTELGWGDWKNDAYILDVNTETATRVELGNGLIYRLSESSRYAVYAQYHPDGDFAHFLDTDATSDTFHTIVGKVPLPAMSKVPTGDDASPWGSEAFRLTGILPSGEYAFVTHGGDGEISVIETRSMIIVGTITTPTPLDFGGYLLGMERGAHTSDTVGR